MHMNKRRTPGNGGIKSVSVFLPALVTVCLLAGCEPWTLDTADNAAAVVPPPTSPAGADASSAPSADANSDANANSAPSSGEVGTLPTNPSVPPNPEGTSAELWTFTFKTYDGTFRIRWPSYFANSLGVGEGSYTLVNGENARFRSFDTDHGANRPSYTMPGPASRLSGTVTCVLFSRQGVALAWFQTPAGGGGGRLP